MIIINGLLENLRTNNWSKSYTKKCSSFSPSLASLVCAMSSDAVTITGNFCPVTGLMADTGRISPESEQGEHSL